MRLVIFITLIFISSCTLKSEKNKITNASVLENNKEDTIIKIDEEANLEEDFELKLEENSNASYSEIKSSILNIRREINQKPISKDSLSKVFTDILVNQIIPYWYGTTWSFEGHTDVPKKGEIACGYFVSTTLKHMGVNINRYRLAQQNPVNEAKSLALNSPVIKISEASSIENIKKINTVLKEGIHFIGFGYNHVGFVLKKNNQLFLIHSNYINSEGVILEKIEVSEAFSYFNEFYLAEISTNETFLQNWLKATSIKVISD